MGFRAGAVETDVGRGADDVAVVQVGQAPAAP
jgi:hypothetical protein